MSGQFMSRDYLNVFSTNNSHAKLRIEDEIVTIEGPWESKNVAIISPADNLAFLKELEHIRLDPTFDAVIHLDANKIEVLFLYVNPDNEEQASLMDLKFTLYYDGARFDCSFAEPSQRLMAIARHTQNFPSDEPGRSVP